MPARHRELLTAMGVSQLTVSKHPHGCLMIFPRPAWEAFRDRVAALPMEASGWKRVFLGNAMDVEIDASSRVLVARELRRAAGMGKNVMLLGMGSHFRTLGRAGVPPEHEAEGMPRGHANRLKNFIF